MNKKISLGAALGLVALTAAIAITCTVFFVMNSLNVGISDYSKRAALFKKLAEVDETVRERYVGNIDATKTTDYTIDGYILGIGDKYGAYLNADEYRQIELRNKGLSSGIGVNVVDSGDGYIKIASVLAGSPAEKAGVKVNDEIIRIAGSDVKSVGYASAVNQLTGKEGTAAKFTVLRGGRTKDFSVPRKNFAVSSVQSKRIGNIGYVKIIQFDSNTNKEFSTQVDALIKGGAKGLVFDVRNNPGGLLEAVEPMIDKLCPAGPVVRAKYKTGGMKTLYMSDANQINLPMDVVTNQNTASAAELFTAALKDYHKAKSVGVTTYGKGTMQQIIDLNDGTALDLSVARFYPPKSDNFEGRGVKPDIQVQLSADKQQNFYSLSDDQDDQLQAAVSDVELQIK